jgi:hypothetical protein
MGRVEQAAVDAAQEVLERHRAKKAAAKAAKDAENKKKWDTYYEQLEKSTPFESGGAKRSRRNRRGRIFRFE